MGYLLQLRRKPDVKVLKLANVKTQDAAVWKTWDAFAKEYEHLEMEANGFAEEKRLRAVLQDEAVEQIRLRYILEAWEARHLGPPGHARGENPDGAQEVIITLRASGPTSITTYAPKGVGIGGLLKQHLELKSRSLPPNSPKAQAVLRDACRALSLCETREDCEAVLSQARDQTGLLESDQGRCMQEILEETAKDLSEWHSPRCESRIRVAARLQLGGFVLEAKKQRHAERMMAWAVLAIFVLLGLAAWLLPR